MHRLIAQNIPLCVADERLTPGYWVDHISRFGPAQAGDPEIIRYALQRGMSLATQDLELALRMPHPHCGSSFCFLYSLARAAKRSGYGLSVL